MQAVHARKININKRSIDGSIVGTKPRSKAYGITFVLIILMIWRFYSTVIYDNLGGRSVTAFVIFDLLPHGLVLIYLFFNIARIQTLRSRDVALYIATVVFIALSVIINSSGVEKALAMLITISSMIFYRYYRLNSNEIKKILVYFVLAIIIIALNNDIIFKNAGTTFNPNTIAFLLTMLYCIMLTMFAKKQKLLYFIVMVVCVMLQFVFESRTAFFGLIAYTVLFILFRAWKTSFRKYTVVISVIFMALAGILLAYFYIQIYEKYGYGFELFGKDLFTGRQYIWQGAFTSISQNFWFGVGSHLNEDLLELGYFDYVANAHNQPLGTLVAFGILGFTTFYLLFAHALAGPYKRKEVTRAPALFIIVVLGMSFFDIYFFSSLNYLCIIIDYVVISSISTKLKRGGMYDGHRIYSDI